MPRNPHCVLFQGIPGWTMKSFFQIARRVRDWVPDTEVRIYIEGPTPKPLVDDPQVVYAHMETIKYCEGQMASSGCKLYTRQALDFDFLHAAVWCFPTTIPQPDDERLIRESQQFGAIPIINPLGVLGRDLIGGVPLWGIPAIDPLVRMRYACETTRLLLDENLQDAIRTPMMEQARERWKVMSCAAD